MSDDIRIPEIIKSGDHGNIVLLGFPYDEGVRRNGGRVGASKGPSSFRKVSKRVGTVFNPEFDIDIVNSGVLLSDAGDIIGNLELEKAHQVLHEKVFKIISEGGIPFVIGGGNDQSYPNALGLLKHNKDSPCKVGVINIDAHLDVRPKKDGLVHSGSPFRMLLEEPSFKGKNFIEFACQGVQCSKAHVEYLKEKGSEVMWLSEIQKDGPVKRFKKALENLEATEVFVSFDIDSIQSGDCPGVSCPALIGLTAQEALDICFESGKSGKVKLLDVSEYNPDIEEYRTGRLIGYMFSYFVYGFIQRLLLATKNNTVV